MESEKICGNEKKSLITIMKKVIHLKKVNCPFGKQIFGEEGWDKYLEKEVIMVLHWKLREKYGGGLLTYLMI